MADVHAEGHMRLAAIAAEVTLSDQEADEESEARTALAWQAPCCFTVMLHGKHRA